MLIIFFLLFNELLKTGSLKSQTQKESDFLALSFYSKGEELNHTFYSLTTILQIRQTSLKRLKIDNIS